MPGKPTKNMGFLFQQAEEEARQLAERPTYAPSSGGGGEDEEWEFLDEEPSMEPANSVTKTVQSRQGGGMEAALLSLERELASCEEAEDATKAAPNQQVVESQVPRQPAEANADPKKMILCPLGCGQEGQAMMLDLHMQKYCPKRPRQDQTEAQMPGKGGKGWQLAHMQVQSPMPSTAAQIQMDAPIPSKAAQMQAEASIPSKAPPPSKAAMPPGMVFEMPGLPSFPSLPSLPELPSLPALPDVSGLQFPASSSPQLGDVQATDGARFPAANNALPLQQPPGWMQQQYGKGTSPQPSEAHVPQPAWPPAANNAQSPQQHQGWMKQQFGKGTPLQPSEGQAPHIARPSAANNAQPLQQHPGWMQQQFGKGTSPQPSDAQAPHAARPLAANSAQPHPGWGQQQSGKGCDMPQTPTPHGNQHLQQQPGTSQQPHANAGASASTSPAHSDTEPAAAQPAVAAPSSLLTVIRLGIANEDRAGVRAAVAAAKETGVVLEDHIEKMLQKWLANDPAALTAATPPAQAKAGVRPPGPPPGLPPGATGPAEMRAPPAGSHPAAAGVMGNTASSEPAAQMSQKFPPTMPSGMLGGTGVPGAKEGIPGMFPPMPPTIPSFGGPADATANVPGTFPPVSPPGLPKAMVQERFRQSPMDFLVLLVCPLQLAQQRRMQLRQGNSRRDCNSARLVWQKRKQ
jgi:hypothetical protein